MKFTCEKALLVSATSLASRTVAAKSVIAELEGIHVRAGMDLFLTGYNLETGITVKVPAQIQEPGCCIVPARLFFDIIRKLPDDMVSVEVDANLKMRITAGLSSFTISASDAEEYPELPDVEYDNGITMPQGELKKLIAGTIFSISENQARPIHTGCLVEVTQQGVEMIAVDGYRLARRAYRPEEPLEKTMKFVVPGAALKEVEKILTDTEEPVTFTLGPKHILFQMGDATLVCRTLEGEFLDWRRVVPADNPISLTVPTAQFTASVERVGLIVSEKLKSPVRCVFENNVAKFNTVTTIGQANDQCQTAGDGQNLEIGFNCRYLLEALRAVPAEYVQAELSNGLSPIVLRPCEQGQDFTYMVLPVRLKNG